MNSMHLRNCERAQRVCTHIESQPEDFPEESKGANVCALIRQDIVKINGHDVVRSSSMSKRRQGTAARQTTRRLLQNLTRSIVSTSEIIALERPDIRGMFVRPQKNASDQTLIADARAMADKAAPLVGMFTENGLTPTFINDLKSHADSLENSMQLQIDGVDERVRTNTEIKKIIRHMNGLIEQLDILVRNKHTGDSAKLAAWESARRLEHPPRSNRNGGNNASPPASQQ